MIFDYDVVELENRLLSRFDAASQRRDLSTMAECAKILSQVNCFFCSMRLYNSVTCSFIFDSERRPFLRI